MIPALTDKRLSTRAKSESLPKQPFHTNSLHAVRINQTPNQASFRVGEITALLRAHSASQRSC